MKKGLLVGASLCGLCWLAWWYFDRRFHDIEKSIQEMQSDFAAAMPTYVLNGLKELRDRYDESSN